MNNIEFKEQIEQYFELKTIPIYVPGIDIELGADEMIFSAKKPLEQPDLYDYLMLEFVIRDGKIFIIKGKQV